MSFWEFICWCRWMNCCPPPHSTRRGSRWREFHKLPQIIQTCSCFLRDVMRMQNKSVAKVEHGPQSNNTTLSVTQLPKHITYIYIYIYIYHFIATDWDTARPVHARHRQKHEFKSQATSGTRNHQETSSTVSHQEGARSLKIRLP